MGSRGYKIKVLPRFEFKLLPTMKYIRIFINDMEDDYLSSFVPKLIAFDLDGTIWNPEMYQLWGGGAPFKKIANSNKLKDSKGTHVELLGESANILHMLHQHSNFRNTKVAWVSCCDEPEWALECLQLFTTSDNSTVLSEVAHSSQIFKDNKQAHFRNLQREFPHIQFHEMLFFDNEMGNIRNVMKLGNVCYPRYTTKCAFSDFIMMLLILHRCQMCILS
jgi:magnesium-dependent phosphatase 1